MNIFKLSNRPWLVALVVLVFAITSGCQAIGYNQDEIPTGVPRKYNVAVVLAGSRQDEGWSQAHYEGYQYLVQTQTYVNGIAVENVSEFNSTQKLFRTLALKGYQMVVSTAYGYQESLTAVAADYPDVLFVQVLGDKSNGKNLATLNNSLEEMVFLAGMLAGARAQMDENPRLGFIATFPTPEQFRWINAAARGMRQTCEPCKMQIRWLYAWNDVERESQLAKDLYASGVDVLFSGTGTPFIVDAAVDANKWAVPLGLPAFCSEKDRCLTSAYWNWGRSYQVISEQDRSGGLQELDIVLHADDGGMGLFGFMEGQSPQPGIQDLPADIQQSVSALLKSMLAGDENALQSVFAGPIIDNQKKTLLADGEHLGWDDLSQFPPGAPGKKCKICMYWWADGIQAELPKVVGVAQ